MHTFIVILLFLIYCPYFGWANIECSLNKNVSYADLHLSDHTMQTMKLPDDRNATELNVFRCMCDSDSAETLDETSADNEFEDGDSKWDEADVLQITKCSDLTLRLQSIEDGIADKFDGKVLLIENIGELYVPEFLAGAPINDFKSFSTIGFRNLTFKQIPSYLEFKDRAEVVFYNISLSEDFPSIFEIRITNEEQDLDPVFRMEKSTFQDVAGLDQLGGNPLKIFWKNNHKDGDRCNFDYKGQLILLNNDFGYLNNKNILIEGGDVVDIYNNSMHVMNEMAIELFNVKKANFEGNYFGVAVNTPALFFEYDERVGSGCDRDDLSSSDVNNTFKNNMFATFYDDFFQLTDLDENYSDDFVKDAFKIDGNGLLQPCKCNQKMSESEDQNNDDDDDKTLGKQMIKHENNWLCLTDHQPPILGNQKDVCMGIKPENGVEIKEKLTLLATLVQKNHTDTIVMKEEQFKKEKEDSEKKHQKDINSWTVGTVLGIFITMIITAFATVMTVKYCCT